METKVIGAVLVILACGGFGFSMAFRHKADILFLRSMIGVLGQMQCELNYHLTPLPTLCRRIDCGRSKQLSQVMRCFSDALDSQIFPDVGRCMQMAVGRMEALSGNAKEVLLDLGQALGKYDLQGQQQCLEAVHQSCCKKLEELEENKDVRIRSYQTLGICAGAAIALFLL